MNSLMGFSKDFVQDKFTSDEIQQAIDRSNEKYGVEVYDCHSQIKVYPKDKNSLNDPILITVEHHVGFPKERIWHVELLTLATFWGVEPHNDPRNHARWAGIPFAALLDKVVIAAFEELIVYMPAGGLATLQNEELNTKKGTYQ